MAYDAVSSVFTVFGSSVSCLATLGILLYCIASRGRHTSLRHALIVNLCLADFLNTLTTTISGFIYVDTHHLYPGPACNANAFFALMTAQAADFTILTITLITLLAIFRLVHLPSLSLWRNKLLICSSTWAIPFLTSLTGLIKDAFRPVDINWCEITATKSGLRYALVRGWRMAIILVAMCLYAFIWWFVHQNYSSFSATKGVGASRGVQGSDHTRRHAFTTASPPRASKARWSSQGPPRLNRNAKGTVCSEVSLPLQGYDYLGAEVEEREKAIDSRTERISRWIYVRHPGLINSISAFKPQSQSRLILPPTSPDPPPARPFSTTMALKPPVSPLPVRLSRPLRSRLQYHGQGPKAQRSLEVTTDKGLGIAMSSPVAAERQMSEPRHHDCVKSISSAEARTQSSFETVPWRICSAAQPSQVNWPFLDDSSSSVHSSSRASTPALSRKDSGASARRHIHIQKVKQPSKVHADHNVKPSNSLRAVRSDEQENSSQVYHTLVPRLQHRSAPTKHRPEGLSEHPASLGHSELPVRRSFQKSADHAQKDAISSPTYYSQFPKVNHTFETSATSPQEPRPGPLYHNQRPRVIKTVSIIDPPGSVLPRVPSLTHQRGSSYTKTATITAARDLPLFPTPGISPPSWSADSKEQRRRTFLLSRSTWSDSTSTQPAATTGDTARNAREIRRTLLLNTYPLAYIIFWLPWMVTSFIEARGRTLEEPRVMHALLGLPQYLGLVNAVIFAINESLKTMRRKVRTADMGRASGEKGLLDVEDL